MNMYVQWPMKVARFPLVQFPNMSPSLSAALLHHQAFTIPVIPPFYIIIYSAYYPIFLVCTGYCDFLLPCIRMPPPQELARTMHDPSTWRYAYFRFAVLKEIFWHKYLRRWILGRDFFKWYHKQWKWARPHNKPICLRNPGDNNRRGSYERFKCSRSLV